MDDFHTINEELRLYQPELLERPQLVAANKMDLAEARDNLPRLQEAAEDLGYRVFPVSPPRRAKGWTPAGVRGVGAGAAGAAVRSPSGSTPRF